MFPRPPANTKSYFFQKIDSKLLQHTTFIFITRGLYNNISRTTMSTSIIKQLLINKLDFSSKDLLDTIKSFCFYDTKTWETISFIKSKKERIHYLLNNETFSRANPINDTVADDNNEEYWAFWVENEDDGLNPQFQTSNCRVCGNYITTNPIVPNHIKCHCHVNDNDWHDEDWMTDGTDP
jgi:hypothetical protein